MRYARFVAWPGRCSTICAGMGSRRNAMNPSFPVEPSWRQRLRGHTRTLLPFFARTLRPVTRPVTSAWSLEVSDPDVGPVMLTGRFLKRSSEEAVVVVHGLGGSTESGYMALALSAADRAGKSCLLLNFRGADRLGADIYHSGLSADITPILKSPELCEMKSIDLFGYSIGGHILLRYSIGEVDPRVRRVAAIGSPLDLKAAADDFDAASLNVYRGHVLDALKEIYTAAYQRRPSGLVPFEARKVRRIRDWDERIVAPRFGFSGADNYYQTQSVGPDLHRLKVEALYVGATHDPMVHSTRVQPYLGA